MAHRGTNLHLDTVPLMYGHEYDLPGDAHLGHAAALHVPCSEGPAEFVLDRTEVSDRALIEAECPIEPGRQMEAGTVSDLSALHLLAPLFTPLRPSVWLESR